MYMKFKYVFFLFYSYTMQLGLHIVNVYLPLPNLSCEACSFVNICSNKINIILPLYNTSTWVLISHQNLHRITPFLILLRTEQTHKTHMPRIQTSRPGFEQSLATPPCQGEKKKETLALVLMYLARCPGFLRCSLLAPVRHSNTKEKKGVENKNTWTKVTERKALQQKTLENTWTCFLWESWAPCA